MIKEWTDWEQSGVSTAQQRADLKAKEDLARAIIGAALKHVKELGFTVKLATGSSRRSAKFMVTEDLLWFYHPDKD